MPKLTAEQLVEKHARRLKGSVADIQDGIARVTVSPTTQAAAKQDKMLQNLTTAVNSGKWKRGLQNVSLEQWKEAAITKGVPRIAQGIDGAHDKMLAFANQLLPFQANLQATLDKMPDLNLEDSVNRSAAWIRGMSKFVRK
jgi:hypothetical protein